MVRHLKLKVYRPARFDLHESVTIGCFEKDINRYRFFIFYFTLEYAASGKNEFNLLLVRVTVCIESESCLPNVWRTFFR